MKSDQAKLAEILAKIETLKAQAKKLESVQSTSANASGVVSAVASGKTYYSIGLSIDKYEIPQNSKSIQVLSEKDPVLFLKRSSAARLAGAMAVALKLRQQPGVVSVNGGRMHTATLTPSFDGIFLTTTMLTPGLVPCYKTLGQLKAAIEAVGQDNVIGALQAFSNFNGGLESTQEKPERKFTHRKRVARHTKSSSAETGNVTPINNKVDASQLTPMKFN